VLNAANEAAVAAFLGGQLSFLSIAEVIECTMDASEAGTVTTLDDVRRVDRWAREFAQELVRDYN
jgi:1-deoxy-D-xylulose-5-phosphate reductoisomerase